MKRFALVLGAFAVAATTSLADARVALKDDKTIENGLVLVATGKILRDTCTDITPRVIKAISFARSLQARAKSLGRSARRVRLQNGRSAPHHLSSRLH